MSSGNGHGPGVDGWTGRQGVVTGAALVPDGAEAGMPMVVFHAVMTDGEEIIVQMTLAGMVIAADAFRQVMEDGPDGR